MESWYKKIFKGLIIGLDMDDDCTGDVRGVVQLLTSDDFPPECREPSSLNDTLRRVQERYSGLVDKERLRRDQDWSFLNQQVVGGEVPVGT